MIDSISADVQANLAKMKLDFNIGLVAGREGLPKPKGDDQWNQIYHGHRIGYEERQGIRLKEDYYSE